MDIKQYLQEQCAEVERAMADYMLGAAGPVGEHIKAMRYSLFAGGKRVRPILCLAATAVITSEDDLDFLMPVAVALECIHTYSLIHDDLPAMDDDDLRRGKPTNHRVFGEAAAILAGDGLLTYAFDLLSRPTSANRAADQVKIISIIAKAAGSLGMVGGQALDIAAEGEDIDFEKLCRIHSRKTGALITAAVEAGAVAGKADNAQFAALSEYGHNIGLAFQIVDDLLNVEGTTEQLGKAAGSDAQRQKATYPAFFGVEETREKAKATVAAAIDALAIFDQRADPLRELAQYIFTRKK